MNTIKEIIFKYDLSYYYSCFNEIYFNNTLTPSDFITLRWNSRLGDIAGMCIKKYNEVIIELNPIYLEFFPQEFENIMVHEMIHLITIEHDDVFKAEIERIKKLGLDVYINCNYKLSDYIIQNN